MDHPPPRPNAHGAGGNSAGQSGRAERFEEEKRRIIDSCFSKKDPVDGSLLETYITHIRILEFSTHPTSPPPPEARTPQTEKPRVIIVAVRKSGRVRMHKSKENANGSFSIGKTWDLNDMSAIESFTDPKGDPQYRSWAGDVGFIVNLGKPYYWQAQTDKEKKFFIASLIKIYGKYTGGNVPELRGFDAREHDQVLGTRRQQQAPPPVAPVQRAPPPSSKADVRPPSRSPSQPPSRPEPVFAPMPKPPAALSVGSPPPTQPSDLKPYRQTPPPRSLAPPNGSTTDLSQEPSIRTGSRPPPELKRIAASNKSQDSVAASITSMARSEDNASLPPRSRGGMPGPGAFGRFGDSAPQTPNPPQAPPQAPKQLDPPDRKRPPMDPGRSQAQPDSDLVPAPLMSPGKRREPREPPPRSTERTRQNSIGQRSDTSSTKDKTPTPSAAPSQVTPVMPPAEPVKTPTPAQAPKPPPLAPARASVEPPKPVVAPEPPAPKEEASTPGTPGSPDALAEDERPGLGPMIRNKKSKADIAGSIWKAASAVSAFKPRAGGAAERFRKAAEMAKTGDAAADSEPDGITGVVPAPPRPVPPPEVVQPEAPKEQTEKERMSNNTPELKVTAPNSRRPSSVEAPKEAPKEEPKENQLKGLEAQTKEDRNRRVAAGNDAKYFTALGVDTSLLAETSFEFAGWLDHFGWIPGEQMRHRNVEEMKLDIDREIGKAQAGGWIARFEQEDDRVDAIKMGLDVAIAECEEMDNLLTLYSVELSTLSDDIAYIEAQGQGLQVQASNQKLLRKELESLLDTCAITADDLRSLATASLDTTNGLEDIEHSLVTLYKAMMKIDPFLKGTGPRKPDEISAADQPAGLGTNYGKMRIVQEKKQMYVSESSHFLMKLEPFMSRQFERAASAIEGSLTKKGDPRRHDIGRESLWKYSPLILYAREMDLQTWNRMLQVYQEKNFPLYKSECKDLVDSWKRNIKKPGGDELELLFTAQVERQHESTMTAARKLTVKRSQTLAKSLRSPLGDSSDRKKDNKGDDNRSAPYEVFAGIVDDILPLVEIEQNFIVDFFHATTLETADFPDLVAAVKPRDRRGGDLKRHRLMEPDRELARRVTRAMEVIFSFLEQDLQNTVAWVLSLDPLQGVGVLAVLERKQTEMVQSNQDYLNTIVQKLHAGLESRYSKFVEEQIRAIEETKVKIKKRKGVISFMRVFPHFSAAIENMLTMTDSHSSVRRMVDKEYDRIIKSMFDSLKFIARENPATLTTGSADPEDKEALNFHILLIENMNHFLDEVDTRGLDVLEEWKEAANAELTEHMSLYLNAVMRRPLGKLLEFLENIEAQLAAGKSATMITALPSNSKGLFDKVLSNYDGKEVRKGIEALRKRVDKHFSADEEHEGSSAGTSIGIPSMPGSTSTLSIPGIGGLTGGSSSSSGGGGVLVQRVLRECEKFYGDVEMRISNVTTTVYGGDVLFEWPRQEVKAAFAAK